MSRTIHPDNLPSFANRSGWPWTTGTPALRDRMRDGNEWPRISIITPSFNQGQFLEETIRSVLLQAYPNLEYIIMDGGSTDESLDIIRKYEPWLTYWVSERDNGQADAIYRGFETASGEIIGWLNSDDVLLPGYLRKCAEALCRNPRAELVSAGCLWIDQQGDALKSRRGVPRYYAPGKLTYRRLLHAGPGFHQPAMLWRRSSFFEVGGFDRSLYFCFDGDLFLRLTKRRPGIRTNFPGACFRCHDHAKTARAMETCRNEGELLRIRNGLDTNRTIPFSEWLYTRAVRWLDGLRLRAYSVAYLMSLLRIPVRVSDASVKA